MKVLVAEADPVYRRVLEESLTEWGYEVTIVADGLAARAELARDGAAHLVVLDWTMAGLDGYQVCEDLRNRSGERYTYIILMTARSRKEDLLRGLEAGADDYLSKPFDLGELRLRLNAGRRVLQLQEELITAREAMRHLATRDGLTGAWNRRAITELLERELQRTWREQRPLSLVLADLDHFKKINDTYGHLAGDAVLHEAVRRMTSVIRPYDTVGRYGGEEFLVVLAGCHQEAGLSLAERLRTVLEAEPVRCPEGDIPLTASLGLMVYTGRDRPDARVLLHYADRALYRAKAAGRNRVEVSTLEP